MSGEMDRLVNEQRTARMKRLAARKTESRNAGRVVAYGAVVLAVAYYVSSTGAGAAALGLYCLGVCMLFAGIGGALARAFGMPEQKGLALGGLLGPLGWVVLTIIWAVRKD